MARTEKKRTVCIDPRSDYFKPRGIPLRALESIELTLDELEALRLCYRDRLYQDEAASVMEISRQTVGRILNNAFSKIAEALIEGKAIKIEGGSVVMRRKFQCAACEHVWEVPYGTGRPAECPSCKSRNIHRHEEDRGFARTGGGPGMGRRRCRGQGRDFGGRQA